MKKSYSIVFILAIAAIFSSPAQPQTTGTGLIMGAHWDDGSNVAGTVIVGQMNATGPDTILATRTLSSGWASTTLSLSTSSLYDVTLVASNGKQLVKFPFTAAMINPANLQRAAMNLVFRKTDSSLKSAQISVSMSF